MAQQASNAFCDCAGLDDMLNSLEKNEPLIKPCAKKRPAAKKKVAPKKSPAPKKPSKLAKAAAPADDKVVRKRVHSAAYHRAAKEARNAGCGDLEIKKRAQEAGKKAVQDWVKEQAQGHD